VAAIDMTKNDKTNVFRIIAPTPCEPTEDIGDGEHNDPRTPYMTMLKYSI
jgi:hypothetical protein